MRTGLADRNGSMRLGLDTTILIDALRGAEDVLDFLRDLSHRPYISAITVHEVVVGMRPDEEEQTLELLSWPLVVPVRATEAELSARWRREYAAQGMTLDPYDTLIAACAYTTRATLLTANARDFPMQELQVQTWPLEPRGEDSA